MLTIISSEKVKKLSSDGKVSNSEGELVELRGDNVSEVPREINGKSIENGSIFIEMSTGKIYMYSGENRSWEEFSASSTNSDEK